jgi:ribA/ribD-fused uncharacterized protein
MSTDRPAQNALAHRAHTTDELAAAIRGGDHPQWLMFWGHRPEPDGSIGAGCLSQWYPAPFTVDGVDYPSAEHFMMAAKARLFADADTEARILDAATPADAKRLGRKVAGFNEKVWVRHRGEIVFIGSVAKFHQNPRLAEFLAATGSRVLVEASPYDRIWGIGLRASDPRATDPKQWPGQNLLGFTLMRARAHLAA